MEEKTSKEIAPHDIVENFTYAFNTKTSEPYIIHSNIAFFRFEKMIYELIDRNFVKIKELSMDEFEKLALANYNTMFHLDTVAKMEGFLTRIGKQ